jgi:hypothetical protein
MDLRSDCASCSTARAFVCSERFRVNAQKKSLDVWLNYRCECCEDVWKFPLLERRSVSELGPALDAFAARSRDGVEVRLRLPAAAAARHQDRLLRARADRAHAARGRRCADGMQDALRKRVRDGQRVYMLSKRDLTAERQNGGTSVL